MGSTPNRNETTSTKIKINELVQLSGVSKSTIHHYLNMELLHPPQKLGLNLSVYDSTHLTKLKRIRKLRENKKLSLQKIKEVLANENPMEISDYRNDEAENLISALQEEKMENKALKSEMKRNKIVNAAITLFSKHGYEGTTLEAIADSLHMAKGTVYLYFKSKEALFMDCIDRLTVVAVPEGSWDEIRKENNFLKRLEKRGVAFHKAFPSYKGILTMTKAALGGDNRKLEEKAKNTLSLMTKPIAKDLRRGMANGLFREINDELVSHLILGMAEALGCRLMMDSRYTLEQGMKTMFDVLRNGIMRQTTKDMEYDLNPCSGQITDQKEMTTQVKGIRFGNHNYLKARIGEADVKIDPNRVEKIIFQQQEQSFKAVITGKDGQIEKAEVDSRLNLTGEVPLGGFSIELSNVACILFGAIKPENTSNG